MFEDKLYQHMVSDGKSRHDGNRQRFHKALIIRAMHACGDLNTARLAEEVWPRHGHGPFWERLSKSIFFDCHRKFHDVEQQTIFRPGYVHPFQDDHLFVSHDLAERVRSCEVLNNEATRSYSDHIPVCIEITT